MRQKPDNHHCLTSPDTASVSYQRIVSSLDIVKHCGIHCGNGGRNCTQQNRGSERHDRGVMC